MQVRNKFVRFWKVCQATPDDSGRSVGMPLGQLLLIRQCIEPDREYFQIVAKGEAMDQLALDWLEAEFEPCGEDLQHFFTKDGTCWYLSVAGSRLKACGKDGPAEAAGEWEAQEEGGG